MSFFAWINAWQRRAALEQIKSGKLSRSRLNVELLEDRSLLSGNALMRPGPGIFMHFLASDMNLLRASGSQGQFAAKNLTSPSLNTTSTGLTANVLTSTSGTGTSGSGSAATTSTTLTGSGTTTGSGTGTGTGSGTGTVTGPYPTSPTGYLGSKWLVNLARNYMSVSGQARMNGGQAMIDSFLKPLKRVFEFDRVASATSPGTTVDRVLITVRTNSDQTVGSVTTSLRSMGMGVIGVHSNLDQITGYLPINSLMNLQYIPGFVSAVPVYRPKARTGSVESEGDKVILADTYRNTTGFTGQNVIVGVLSDSADAGSGGIKASQTTGDLPPFVNILEDGPSGSTDEGRAMMEIVHDVAPSSGLAFHTAFLGPGDFADGIEALANVAKARVIVDDVGYFDSPMFNDGIIAQAANDVSFGGKATYVSAAGNNANQGWMGNWNGITATVGGISGTFEDVGNGTPFQSITVANGGVLQLAVQWDAAFLEGGAPLSKPNFQVPNNVDVYVVDRTPGSANFGTIVASSTDINQNTGEAFENMFFGNGTNDTQFAVVYQLVSGPAPSMLRWVNFGDDPAAFGEGAPTTFGQPAAAGAIAVGAVHWTTPNQPEPFTSVGGPLTFLFDANGNRLATPEIRNKPEVTGPDGVSTTFFGDPDPMTGQKHAFFGTSAAAPHVAGAAALYLNQAPTASPDDILVALRKGAVDITPTGLDNLTGSGLIQVTGIKLNQFLVGPIQGNDTSNTAHDFGVLPSGTSQTYSGLVIKNQNGLPDYDWFKWTMGSGGTFTSTVNRTEGGTLELHIFTVINGVLTELKKDTTPLAKFHTASVVVNPGEVIYVEVKGANSAPGILDQGVYNLSVSLV
ncbi:MAG: S8 family peptidase [Gemmataceae bacterium]